MGTLVRGLAPISWSWSSIQPPTSVEISPSTLSAFTQLGDRGTDKASGPTLDWPEPRHRAILCNTYARRCQVDPAIVVPQSGISSPRLPPTTALIRRSTVRRTFASRMREDIPKTHTHMQQVARCAHVHIGAGSDGLGSGHLGEDRSEAPGGSRQR
jgi:hypothetical protein